MWWIKARSRIHPALLSLVKMGTTANQKRLFFNLRRLKGRIQAIEEGDLKPDQVAEIATKLQVSEEEVISMNRRLSGDASLNAPIKAAEGDSGQWQDWLVDEHDDQETVLIEQDEMDNRRSMLAARCPFSTSANAASSRPAACARTPSRSKTCRPIRHFPRTRPPDRGPRLREGAGRRPPGRARPGQGLARGRSHPPDPTHPEASRGRPFSGLENESMFIYKPRHAQ